MADDFFDKLGAEWRDQEIADPARRPPLPRNRFTPHLAFALEAAICGATFLVGLLFLRDSIETGAPVYAYAAAALISGSCAILAALFDARRSSFAWRDESPTRLVRTGLDRAEATLRTLRVGRWHVVAITGFVAFLWCVQLAGRLHAARFLVIYTLVCAVLCAGTWVWLDRRERRTRRRVEAYRALLAEYEEAGVEAASAGVGPSANA